MNRRTPMRHRRGFTLMEISVASVASTILIVGMGTSIRLAARASDKDLGKNAGTVSALQAVQDLERELSLATAIDAVSGSRRVKFTLPDITGDGTNDVVDYSWSGTAAAPLQRAINGGTARTIVDKLQNLTLTYRRDLAEGETANETSESKWIEQTSDSASHGLTSGAGIAVTFHPTLPSGATQWRINRIRVKCRQSGLEYGDISARVYRAGSDSKPSVLLDQVTIDEASLPILLSADYTISFPAAGGLLPAESASIVLLYQSGGGTTGSFRVIGAAQSGSQTFYSSDSGASWSLSSTQALRCEIWGTCTLPEDGTSATFQYSSVDVKLTPSSDTSAPIYGAIRLWNNPEAPAP